MGKDKNSHLVYLIDFGLSKFYIDEKGKHIKYKDGKQLTGTARYASIFTHMGIDQSRRDDLESLAYTLIYLIKGDLPWKSIKSKTKKEKYEHILKMKKNMNLENLSNEIPGIKLLFLIIHSLFKILFIYLFAIIYVLLLIKD